VISEEDSLERYDVMEMKEKSEGTTCDTLSFEICARENLVLNILVYLEPADSGCDGAYFPMKNQNNLLLVQLIPLFVSLL